MHGLNDSKTKKRGSILKWVQGMEPNECRETEDGSPTFWYGRHGQRHSDLEVVHGTAQPAAAVNRVVEVAHVDGPDRDAYHTDHLEGAPV